MKIPGMNVDENRNDFGLWVKPFPEGCPTLYKCSQCGGMSILCPTRFCGDCGALMVNWPEAKTDYESYNNPMPEMENPQDNIMLTSAEKKEEEYNA